MTGRESSFKSIPSCSHVLFKLLKHDSGDTFSRFQPREEIHGKSRFPGLTSDLKRQLRKRQTSPVEVERSPRPPQMPGPLHAPASTPAPNLGGGLGASHREGSCPDPLSECSKWGGLELESQAAGRPSSSWRCPSRRDGSHRAGACVHHRGPNHDDVAGEETGRCGERLRLCGEGEVLAGLLRGPRCTELLLRCQTHPFTALLVAHGHLEHGDLPKTCSPCGVPWPPGASSLLVSVGAHRRHFREHLTEGAFRKVCVGRR